MEVTQKTFGVRTGIDDWGNITRRWEYKGFVGPWGYSFAKAHEDGGCFKERLDHYKSKIIAQCALSSLELHARLGLTQHRDEVIKMFNKLKEDL